METTVVPWDNIGDDGKENGNYYSTLGEYRVLLGLFVPVSGRATTGVRKSANHFLLVLLSIYFSHNYYYSHHYYYYYYFFFYHYYYHYYYYYYYYYYYDDYSYCYFLESACGWAPVRSLALVDRS